MDCPWTHSAGRGPNSPDFAAAQVLGDVLSSQRGSLYALVPQGDALYAGFSLDGLPEASLGYALAAFPEGADGSALLSRMARSSQTMCPKVFQRI